MSVRTAHYHLKPLPTILIAIRLDFQHHLVQVMFHFYVTQTKIALFCNHRVQLYCERLNRAAVRVSRANLHNF